MDAINTTLGDVIKTRRTALGLTQAELARRVGCAEITVRKLEADALRPSIQMAELLALALGIPEREQLAFVQLARQERPLTPIPTPSPMREEIGQEDLSGRAIRGYELGKRINAGGFGVVYEAVQTTVARDVAVKIILPQYADHPDFIRRFEVEAQLIAQLEHPHIVPLYDYWREPGVAYLIMQLMRGGSLEDILKTGPLPPETLMPMLIQVGAALHTAHQAGIIHRDIKPANVLLDTYNNAYLADFGIAKNLGLDDHTQDGAVIGSPAYISPEQIKAEPVKAAADIYGLGIMVYELLTGEKPFLGPTPIAYIQQHLNEPIPPLVGELPLKTEEVLLKATAKNPADRYEDIPAFMDALQNALFGGKTAVSPNTTPLTTVDLAKLENPYKGLRAFTEADAHNFFGRETLIQSLLAKLTDGSDLSRFLAIVGPSGSGKSSVAKAGLIPALRRGGIPGSDKWFAVEMTPGTHPFEELEAALLRVAINPPESILAQLRQDERGFLRASKRILPTDPDIELLLLIDQFEELFTLTEDEAVRTAFLDSLITAVLDSRSRLRIVITMRADFTDKPLQYVDFGDLMRQRTEFVLPLTADELEQVVVQPVAQQGMTLESGLTAQIIRDVGQEPGMLPLLQYALTELFERHENGRLTKSAYEENGGALGALGHRGDDIYQELTPDERDAARQLFLRLVTLGEGVEDTRRRVRRAELLSMQTAVSLDEIIDGFGKHRLLTFDRDPVTREPTVEIAHEALLREWRQLRDWIADNRDDVRMERLLQTAVNEWNEAEQDESYLLRGSRLLQFEGWVGETAVVLTTNESTFLEASVALREEQISTEEKRRQRELETAQQLAETERLRADEQTQSTQRLQKWAMALAGILVIAVLFAIAAATFARQSQQNADVAATRQVEALTNADLAASREAEAIAESNQRATAEAVAVNESIRADTQRDNAIAAEATAEAEAVFRATAEAVAVEEREEALRQASIGLAAQAVLELEGDSPERAVLLALEALEEYPYTGQAESALMQAVEAFKPYAILPPPTNLLRMRNAIWSPDGKQVVAVGIEGHIVFWDVNTGEEIASYNERDDSVMLSIAWASDGTRLATASELLGVARIWDAETGALLLTFEEHGGAVNSIALSQDGNLALTASADGTARVWETATGAEQLVLNDHAGGVTDAIWSPEEDQILTASTDGFIRLWDAATGENLRTLAAHASGVLSLTWEPDGTRAATSGMDGIAQIWDMESGESLYTLIGHNAEVRDIDWSPDGNRLATASADGTARVWDTRDGGELFTLYGLTSDLWTVNWSPDGNQLLTGGGLTTRISDVSAQEIRLVGHTNTLIDAQWSPDMSLIVTTGFDGTARTWDAETGELLTTFRNHTHTAPVSQIVGLFGWSPSGNQVVTPGFDGAFRLWDARSGEESLVILHEEVFPMVAEWSPDGTRVAGGDFAGFGYVWDAETGEEILVIDNNCSFLEPAWSPDGTRIVTSCNPEDEGDVVWDAETGERLVTFNGHPELGSNRTDWSPDGTKIISPSPDTTIQIWDAATGEVERIFSGHTALLYDAEFSPDGQRVASGDESGMVRIWEAETGVEVYRFEVDGGVLNVEWSPDGASLIVSGWFLVPEIRRIWPSTEALIDHAYDCCAIRELTLEEREMFGLPPAP